MGKGEMHDPVSHNCAINHVVHLSHFPYNFNSTELHRQGVAHRSQYSDHALEAVTLQQFAPIIAHKANSQ